MKAQITNRTDSKITFVIQASTEEINHAKEHAYERFRPDVKVAGFRPGKAPDNIVAKEVGDASIQGEALEHAINHAYSDAIREEQAIPIAQPQVDVKKWVPYTELEFEATIEVVPPVKLPDYTKVKKAAKKVNVSKAQIDEMVEDLRRRIAKRVPVTRAAELDDEVKFDFLGKKDGEPFEGGAGQNYTLKLGSGQFIPGFEEQMVGLKVGEEKTLPLTFPKDYHEKSLAGADVTFDVKLHEITALELPKLDDHFAGEAGPFKTLKELRADVEKQLAVEGEEAAKREFENELLEDLISKSKLTVPEVMVMQQIERMKSEIAQRLSSSGLTIEQYLQAQGQNQDDMEKEIRPEAEKRVKLALVLGEVAKQEKTAISEEEIEAEITKLRTQYTDPTMQKELEGARIREDIYNHLMSGKVISTLIDYAKK